MFLHDINAPGVENEEALVGVRQSLSLIRDMPYIVGFSRLATKGAELITAL
jgi:hypothetical protein